MIRCVFVDANEISRVLQVMKMNDFIWLASFASFAYKIHSVFFCCVIEKIFNLRQKTYVLY